MLGVRLSRPWLVPANPLEVENRDAKHGKEPEAHHKRSALPRRVSQVSTRSLKLVVGLRMLLQSQWPWRDIHIHASSRISGSLCVHWRELFLVNSRSANRTQKRLARLLKPHVHADPAEEVTAVGHNWIFRRIQTYDALVGRFVFCGDELCILFLDWTLTRRLL